MSSSMLRKKEVFTIITPIPSFIPRQLAIDILHSHSEVITLNPLVLDHKPIKAPGNAVSDEYYSTWYEIIERIQYIPGLGRLGSGKISFKGCFHDMPWGLQTHIYAPMSIDLRNRYRISGNQSGFEPPEQPEIGLAALGAPSDGLYLRDDVEIKCNVAMISFVKSQLRAASREMVARILKKAELIDAGVLHAMIENGRLKTINPNDRTNTMSEGTMSSSPRLSPASLHHQSRTMSPSPVPYQVPRHKSLQQFSKPGTPVRNPHWSAPYDRNKPLHHSTSHAELPGPEAVVGGGRGRGRGRPDPQAPNNAAVEMPGDFSYPQPSPHSSVQAPQPSPTYTSDRDSIRSGQSSRMSPRPASDWRWSQSQPSSQGGGGGGGGGTGGSSRPTSPVSSSDVSSCYQSPGLEQQGFSSDLPTHDETTEEHGIVGGVDALVRPGAAPGRKRGGTARRGGQTLSPYRPADYARVGTSTTSPPPGHAATSRGYGF